MHLSTIPQNGFYNSYARLRQDIVSLTNDAVAWDQTFESAIGTYPTYEFAASYRSFTDRARGVVDRAKALPFANAYQLEQLLEQKLPLDMGRATNLVTSRLDYMAKHRTPFTHDTMSIWSWSSVLDPMIDDLRRGERLLAAHMMTMEPYNPPTPNPGVPGGSPSYPGGPRPTPIP